MLFLSQTSPLQMISPTQRPSSTLFPQLRLWVKRDDLLHADVSGNKFRKLKHALLSISKEAPPVSHIISMGGAWSNHLHALAHAAKQLNLTTLALVRGTQHANTLSPTLRDCQALGMQLRFLQREEYRHLRDDPLAWQNYTTDSNKSYLWLPEGGSHPLAIKGVAELIAELPFIPDTVVVACGTAATLAGLVAGMQGRGRVIGIAALKNAEYLREQVNQLLVKANYPAYQNFDILQGFEHGGYAKITANLRSFSHTFMQETEIPLEPVYTAKMFFAIDQLCRQGFFKVTESVVAIHTGGLQGRRGFPDF